MLRAESLLVVDKPPGPSSFDIVRIVKRLAGGKVGHTGSLDPFASGVLILLTGKATKLSNVLLNADKTYEAVIKLGEATDSMDRTGTVTETREVPPLTEAQISDVLSSFEGTWMQTPPMYSAKKIRGVRLYELARQNIHVRRTPVPVELYKVKLLSMNLPYFSFEVHCSKGTYIRSLADEIGRKLGTVGHLSELRRTSCAGFSLKQSVTPEVLEADFSACRERGWENYRQFLHAEKLVRTRSLSRQLPLAGPSGKSLLITKRTKEKEKEELRG
ncbi:MAG: tRNA pseudouridine(55) synthase TruB [Bdellovibrionales bacterium]|nr:tRNA pseudouridine(55) synthase TruB [Bdellovibrionales bacterium]